MGVSETNGSSFSSISPNDPNLSPPESSPRKLVRLSPEDHAMVCHSIGGSLDIETNQSIYPASGIYPPRGLPSGLYKDVIRSRVISQYQFYFLATFYNAALILQLLFSASLTALGSDSSGHDLSITILAAANTVNAGLVALMHNSGMPDRFKNDFRQFEGVEEHLRGLIDTGIVWEGVTREEIVMGCWEKFRKAKETVSSNKPAAYIASGGQTGAVGGPARLV